MIAFLHFVLMTVLFAAVLGALLALVVNLLIKTNPICPECGKQEWEQKLWGYACIHCNVFIDRGRWHKAKESLDKKICNFDWSEVE